MVRLAAALACALAWAEGMSITKQVSRQLSGTSRDSPRNFRNFLMLKLPHSGSSWLMAMIGAQDKTYITVEGIHNAVDKPWLVRQLEAMGKKGVLKYLQKALKKPSGDIWHADTVQTFCEIGSSEGWQKKAEAGTDGVGTAYGPGLPHLVSQARRGSLEAFTSPATCACLRKLGADCPVKHLGVALNPMSPVLKDNLDEIFGTISAEHPDLSVLVLRRSNIVKHSLGTGGFWENANGSKYNVPLHQEYNVDDFMAAVRQTVEEDQGLRRAATLFPRVEYVAYEDLYNDPEQEMKRVFKLFDMEGRFEDWMAEIGDKHTPDDLSLLIKNIDEVEEALRTYSPCLAKQLRMTSNVKIVEVCDDMPVPVGQSTSTQIRNKHNY